MKTTNRASGQSGCCSIIELRPEDTVDRIADQDQDGKGAGNAYVGDDGKTGIDDYGAKKLWHGEQIHPNWVRRKAL